MDRRFRLVDVFGERPLTGNPLAVVIDSEALTTEEMLEITRWLDFSETTFLGPATDPGADYAVRIFTLAGELPFAGHPTLGSCHVWQSLADESRDEIIQECGVGLVRLQRTGQRIAFEAPELVRSGAVDPGELEELADVLGIDVAEIRAARWVDNGPGWVGLLLEDADAVLALEPDFSRGMKGGKYDIGVVGMYREGWEHLYEVRAFFSGSRGEMLEDPVTGSLNASIAQWLIGQGLAKTPYVASQGRALGRSGRVHISGDADSVWVGGRVFDVVEGTLSGMLG
ncbi:MAG TPA: PhzF family phenazine biosynthesis protein [Acidimicrobiia bacterium]|nr:PhzF family phenazine biosynthesis protein [Acidimicrobiia bacterium]